MGAELPVVFPVVRRVQRLKSVDRHELIVLDWLDGVAVLHRSCAQWGIASHTERQ